MAMFRAQVRLLVVPALYVSLAGAARAQVETVLQAAQADTVDTLSPAASSLAESILGYSAPTAPAIPTDPVTDPTFRTKLIADQFEILRGYRNSLVEAARNLTAQLQEENEQFKALQQTRSWAGTRSSCSVRSSPIMCSAPPQQGHCLLSTSMTTS